MCIYIHKQEATVPTGGTTVVTNKMDPAHGSSLNKDKEDKEDEVSKRPVKTVMLKVISLMTESF